MIDRSPQKVEDLRRIRADDSRRPHLPISHLNLDTVAHRFSRRLFAPHRFVSPYRRAPGQACDVGNQLSSLLVAQTPGQNDKGKGIDVSG
ncbi:hypothetical protein GCM10029976_028880 [Kribbella albertanoniae]